MTVPARTDRLHPHPSPLLEAGFSDNNSFATTPPLSANNSHIHPHHHCVSSSHYDNQQAARPSTHSVKRGPVYDEEEYLNAYWARIRQQRSDPLSLPLVPFTDEDYGITDEKNHYYPSPHNAHAYPSTRPRQPLIDFVRNEWRSTIGNPGRSPSDESNPTCAQVLAAPRFRRYLFLAMLTLSLFWVSWEWWAGPRRQELTLISKSLSENVKPAQGRFGTNMRPEFRDMIHLKTIDPTLIPQRGDQTRLIIVGDVHGCYDELVALLTEVAFNVRYDHLILAGDLISKGPSSPAVVELARSMRASCVRGNHEDRVLLAHRDLNTHDLTLLSSLDTNVGGTRSGPPDPGPIDIGKRPTPGKILDEKRFAHGDAVDRELARSLSAKQIEYLASCPVILKLGPMKGMGDVQVVHAGLVPGIELERQDPMGVMHMRTMDLETHVPSRGSQGTPWTKFWNEYQTHLPRKSRSTVIYGHDSKRGLQLAKYTKGLDTGCVKGGRLTALIIGHEGAEAKVRSVKCHDYRPKAAIQAEKMGGMGQS